MVLCFNCSEAMTWDTKENKIKPQCKYCNFSAWQKETCWDDSGRSRIFERGFQFQLDKNASSVWVEDQKKVINVHSSLSAVFYIYYWMISNKLTVIRASQSDCSIRESRSDCSIRVYEFQRGVPVETLKPPWICHWMKWHWTIKKSGL